ncbi:SURF1 family protein [Cellulomonas shaoxiangyii]|uniref:SURF1-like protein n=2 Tax=Cellulomonas shaoxiangyii TaxID=2566013 RepID=A0A4P7SLJ2_9CELL|nr:SURF1 family protein [Cellulomonas shaoxiangyii]TGY84134.1 SURF1 family protein [Cellulomonas shaoxiangyii]
MLGLLVLLLAAAAVCGRLGAWQLERAEVRGGAAEERRAVEIAESRPVPLEDVLVPGASVTGEMVARKVVVTGTWEAAGTLLVDGRAHDGVTEGALVLTPLRVDGAGAAAEGAADAGALLPVVRGWTPGTTTTVPDPPTGTVTVVGWLQGGEEAGAPVVDGRTDAISPAQLASVWGSPVYTGYLVVQSVEPGDPADLELLDPPTRSGTGLNVQNLAYAAQWWIFGLFAVGLWWRLVRDEAAGRPPIPGEGDGDGPPPSDEGGPHPAGPDPGTAAQRDVAGDAAPVTTTTR